MRWLTVLLLWLSLVAACGGDPVGDALVVVQETNLPDPQPDPCEEFRFHYHLDVETECGAGDREVDICSDQELCDEQIDALVEPLRTCDQVHGYEAEIPDGC